MKRLLLYPFFFIAITFLFSDCNKPDQKNSTSSSGKKVYKNPDAPIEKRVEDLLSRMTLKEKAGQMTQICQSNITLDGTKALNLKVEGVKDLILEDKIGSILSGSGKASEWVKFIKGIQKIAVEKTRLGIPIIYGMDHVHGADYVDEGTIFPHNLTMSCSFDTSLVRKEANITAIETADLVHSWNFTPVLDVGKNPYWPRLYETFGEDPYVCARMGKTFIKNFQQCKETAPYKQAACAKHFIGYSDPESGWDRTPAYIPMQKLYEDFVPPFQAAINSGVKTIMVNSGEVNGEPVHTSEKLLTGLLRKKLGFEGVVLTDIKDLQKVVDMHSGAENHKEAVKMGIKAGIDMSMACTSTDFTDYIVDFVKSGEISEERINKSVRRILRLKFELGLFEHPYPQEDRLDKTGSGKHKKVAQKAAQESFVLLKNKNNTLPLPENPGKILIAGHAAHSKRLLNGAWTYEWLGAKEERQPQDMETIFTAMKKQFTNAAFDTVTTTVKPSDKKIKMIKRKASQSDYIILTIGEKCYSEFKGNINNLKLESEQAKMVRAVKASGKPVILILVEGRPRVISHITQGVSSVLFTGHPGIEGGEAIASVLSGETNPSGKLSFSYPANVAHNVPYYHKQSDKYTAQYPFGYGLSYSNFKYTDLNLSDTLISSLNKKITATVKVTNKSDRVGKEAVLWYIQDSVGTLTRPVKRLKYFQKEKISSGDTKEFVFHINPEEHFSYVNEKGKPVIEDGIFQVIVGGLEKTIRLKR